jgi:hypothetical protein
MSKHQQRNQRPAPLPPEPPAPVVPAGLVTAHFTERELTELRKICRDADSELGVRFLAEGLARALPIRPVDGVR